MVAHVLLFVPNIHDTNKKNYVSKYCDNNDCTCGRKANMTISIT